MDEGNESQSSAMRVYLLIAVAAVAVLAAATLWLSSRPVTPPPAPIASVPAKAETAEEREARLAAIDPALKTAWLDEVPGVDVSRMSPERRELFVRIANSRSCSCGCGFTLAACRRYDAECDVSGPRVAALADSVAAGWLHDPGGLRRRPD